MDRRAFTLVEVLVVIAIIAVLMGILLPALGLARQRGWDAKCLSNVKQSAAAWLSYSQEHGHFPYAELPEPEGDPTFQHQQPRSWAGVDWYTDDIRADGDGMQAVERPLNDYLGMDPHQTSGGEAVQCPGDDVILQAEFSFGSNAPPPNPRPVGLSPALYERSRSPDQNYTFHGAFGTSYFANEWVWVSTSAPWGLQIHREAYQDLWLTFRNGPEDIDDASRFVLISECGIMDVMRNGTFNINSGFFSVPYTAHNFRHGEHRASTAFLDGAARLLDIPIAYQSALEQSVYTFIPQPQRVAAFQDVYPDFSFNGNGFSGYPPPPIRSQYNLP